MTTADGRLRRAALDMRHGAHLFNQERNFRDLRHAARHAQVAAGLALVTNLVVMVLPTVAVGDVWPLNFVAVVWAFVILTNGFNVDRRAMRERPGDHE